MDDDVFEMLELSFDGAYEALKRDLARIRSGRANPNILDNIRVPYYGQPTALNQVAAVQAPEARMLTIKPWEQSLLKDIERAIQQSDLGLNPSNDGAIIRLVIPALTEERRKKLVRQVHEHGEAAKVAIRNARRNANTELKDLEKASTITEDDLKRELKRVQDATDAATTKVDAMIDVKEKDLMEV